MASRKCARVIRRPVRRLQDRQGLVLQVRLQASGGRGSIPSEVASGCQRPLRPTVRIAGRLTARFKGPGPPRRFPAHRAASRRCGSAEVGRHHGSARWGASASVDAVQSAPLSISRSAGNDVVNPRQRLPAAFAAATPASASSITRHSLGSSPSQCAASKKMSGAGFTHYAQPAESGLALQPVGRVRRVAICSFRCRFSRPPYLRLF
jgi:hypothetical protein